MNGWLARKSSVAFTRRQPSATALSLRNVKCGTVMALLFCNVLSWCSNHNKNLGNNSELFVVKGKHCNTSVQGLQQQRAVQLRFDM